MIENFKNAFQSVWANKVRSLLNIIGVVIGVASVTILVSLGDGLKKDVSGMIADFGTNLIAITGGKLETNPAAGQSTNPANFITGDVLTMNDVQDLQALPELQAVTPAALVAGNLKYDDKTSAPTLFGAYDNVLDSLQILKLDKGRMFKDGDGAVIVLGKNPVKDLFGEVNPIGKKITLGKEQLTVIGTLAGGKSSSFVGSEFDAFALIPFDTATRINKGQQKVQRIYARASEGTDVEAVKKQVKELLLDNHNGEEDFTVLTQDDILDLFNTFLNLATVMVSAIAAISLVVGGIGIMNIMLVTVTERTREIGLRKAVGATKLAILWQFLIEAITVTFIGSLLGLLAASLVDIVIASQTELNPVISPNLILLAVGVSVIVGIVFGLWPAIRAANKDPIEALRYE